MILDLFKLDGQVALVTGSASGLGQAMAVGLAEAGADIMLVGRQTDTSETRKMIEDLGRRCMDLRADLAEPSTPQATGLIADTLTAYGRLDILVNNAGATRRGSPLDVTEEDWDYVLDLNLKAVFLLSQAAAKHFATQQRGKIINTASVLTYQGGILNTIYAASKHGIGGLTRAMATDLAPLGINVNAIAPGYMATRLTQVLRDDPERGPAILGRIPMGHWGDPNDLKGATVFLASAASDYVTGAIIPVDGGWLAR